MPLNVSHFLKASFSLALSAGLVLALVACQRAEPEPVPESALVVTYYFIPQ